MNPTSQSTQGPGGAAAPPSSSSTPVSFLREFSFAQPRQGGTTDTRGERTLNPNPNHNPPPSSSSSSFGAPGAYLQAPDQQRAAASQDLNVVSRTSIVVNHRQQGNPVLAHIRNVRWVFGDIVPDYLLGSSTCALFLSLRYHLLHPDYIFVRIRELQKSFRLRVVLCHVDLDDVIKPLHDITKMALLSECTLLCAWSPEECARYLETLKSYENKPASIIQERLDNDYISRVTGALTSIRHVNKTDSVTLCQTFGTLSAVMGAPMDDLVRCPGIGEKKVRRLHDTFHEPFRRRPPKALKPTGEGASVPSSEGVLKPTADPESNPSGEGALKPTGDGASNPSGNGVIHSTGDATGRIIAEEGVSGLKGTLNSGDGASEGVLSVSKPRAPGGKGGQGGKGGKCGEGGQGGEGGENGEGGQGGNGGEALRSWDKGRGLSETVSVLERKGRPRRKRGTGTEEEVKETKGMEEVKETREMEEVKETRETEEVEAVEGRPSATEAEQDGTNGQLESLTGTDGPGGQNGRGHRLQKDGPVRQKETDDLGGHNGRTYQKGRGHQGGKGCQNGQSADSAHSGSEVHEAENGDFDNGDLNNGDLNNGNSTGGDSDDGQLAVANCSIRRNVHSRDSSNGRISASLAEALGDE